jgi:lycopene beta-cyclase
MLQAAPLKEKKILLIDKDQKNTNDRTWCFWETGPGLFEKTVAHAWEKAWFHAPGFSKLLDIHPYRYKMIRGIDFYRHCLDILRKHPSVDIRVEAVEKITRHGDRVEVQSGNDIYDGEYVFNSILFDRNGSDKPYHNLLQHFKGWIIETKDAVFNPSEATLMDFRPGQDQGTTFVYVMPFTDRKALVEYTLFSPSLLAPEDYDAGLKSYLDQFMGKGEYVILEEEFGIIPMTNYPFRQREGRVMNIGTAGGQTKASTGYTFRFIQKNSEAIVQSLASQKHPYYAIPKSTARFGWYDSVLLNILSYKTLEGRLIFSELFKHNPAPLILKFLDNETSVREELGLLNTLPRLPFMKAGMQEIIRSARKTFGFQ